MLSLVCIEPCGVPERGEESRAPAQCWRPNLLVLLYLVGVNILQSRY